MFTITNIDDKIVKHRAILGLVYGFIAYLIYRLNIVMLFDVSGTIWLFAGIIYIASAFYVQAKYAASGIFQVFIRGIVTYYAIWIIIFLALYDLLG